MRPYDRAVPFHRVDVCGFGIMPEDELAAPARLVVGAEEEAGHWIRVNVAFETHGGSALNVQDDAIPVIACWYHPFRACSPGQLEKPGSVAPVKPRQAHPHLVGVNPAARDMRHILCFTRQDRRARKLPEISRGSNYADVRLPISGKPAGQVECRPAETQRPHQTAREQLNDECFIAEPLARFSMVAPVTSLPEASTARFGGLAE